MPSPEHLIDPVAVAAYLDDAAHVPGGHAPSIAFPQTEREVAEVLSRSATVLPIGAQSSLTGGATPRGDTLLSTARLRGIEQVDAGRIRVGAGVTIAEIDAYLAPRGQLYPPGPTWHGATIGGTVATNAAGAATFKYGTTRDWVDGLIVVLASGDVLELRRGEVVANERGVFEIDTPVGRMSVRVPSYRMPAVPKASAGYFAGPAMDLVDLLVGSEGTLGVVTEVTLRIEPVRPACCLAFVTMNDVASALRLVAQLRSAAVDARRTGDPCGLDISAIEHMDARSLELLREDGTDRRLGLALDPRANIGLLVAIDLPPGTSARDTYDAFGRALDPTADPPSVPEPVARPLASFTTLLSAHGAADTTIVAAPGDVAAAQRLYALREAVPVAVNQRVADAKRTIDSRIEKTAADVIVPFEQFGRMLDLYGAELRRRGLDAAIWGHVSDGNVHPNVIPRSYADVEAGREAVLAFGREAIRLGGAPLAEHGVGRNRIKQQLLRELYGDAGLDQMRAVKRALDRQWKLAPGVIFER